jgi:hypothetical protein
MESSESNQDEMHEAFGDEPALEIALQHLQEMRRSGQFCCIELGSDYDYVWDIQYAWSEQIPHVDGHMKRLGTTASYKSLSDAIEEFYGRWKAGELDTD